MKTTAKLLAAAGLAALLAATWLAYHPGLSGDFLFDDFVNLPLIGDTGPVDDWATLARYLTSGFADPTGRPVALLSFLVDARSWPSEAYPFKHTNVCLHLLNGLLLCWWLLRLGRAARLEERTATWSALFAGACWLLHPLLVSTTLYVVQREAMLPCTFTLLGLLAWLQGRTAWQRGRLLQGGAWVAAGLGLCTLLAILSKANGILLPLLALVTEAFLGWRGAPFGSAGRRSYRATMVLLAGVPSAVVAYVLAERIPGLLSGHVVGGRGWSVGQRLLTECRILLDYLRLLWLPHPFTPGLFNDQIRASTGLFSPWTTLPSLLGIAALLAAIWRLRARMPFAAYALAFFFAGHLLESTLIPLELYFEHRNYLPALPMFWPLGVALARMRGRTLARVAAALAIPALLAGMTWMRADVWGNGPEQARIWYRLNPESPRALANATDYQVRGARPGSLLPNIESHLRRDPSELQYAMGLVMTRCRSGGIGENDLVRVRRALRTTRSHTMMPLTWVGGALDNRLDRACRGLDLDAIDALLGAMLENPAITGSRPRRREAMHLRGRVALLQDRPRAALQAFDDALRVAPSPGAALSQAALLGATGHPCEGLEHLDLLARLPTPPLPHRWNMATVHAWVLRRQRYWEHELARLRKTLEDDASRTSCPARTR